jgi:hypothetical protein
VAAVYDDLRNDEHKIHEILHTRYAQKRKKRNQKTIISNFQLSIFPPKDGFASGGH